MVYSKYRYLIGILLMVSIIFSLIGEGDQPVLEENVMEIPNKNSFDIKLGGKLVSANIQYSTQGSTLVLKNMVDIDLDLEELYSQLFMDIDIIKLQGGTNVTVENQVFNGTQLRFDYVYGGTIINNTFINYESDTISAPLWINGSGNIRVEGNTIANTTYTGYGALFDFVVYFAGIIMFNSTSISILNNFISNVVSKNPVSTSISGIHSLWSSVINIANNILSNMTAPLTKYGFGIKTEGTSGNITGNQINSNFYNFEPFFISDDSIMVCEGNTYNGNNLNPCPELVTSYLVSTLNVSSDKINATSSKQQSKSSTKANTATTSIREFATTDAAPVKLSFIAISVFVYFRKKNK